MPNAFDPSTLLDAADQSDQDQLTELEKEVAVLGGKVMQLVREVVESIHMDDKASVATQIVNAQMAKAMLVQANAQLRQTPEQNSETPQPPQADPAPTQPPAPTATSASPAPAKKAKKAKKAAAPSAPAPAQQPTKKSTSRPAKKAASPAPTQPPAPTATSASPAPAKKAASPAPAPTPTPISARIGKGIKTLLSNTNN